MSFAEVPEDTTARHAATWQSIDSRSGEYSATAKLNTKAIDAFLFKGVTFHINPNVICF